MIRLTFLIFFITYAFVGCSYKPSVPQIFKPPVVEDTKPVVQSPIDSAKNKVKDALDEREKAVEKGDELGRLKAEKKALAAQLDKVNAEHDELTAAIKRKDKEIGDERINVARDRAYIVAGICLFLGAVAAAVSFFLSVPFLARMARTAAGVLGAMAILCMAFAWIVPYIWPIVGGLAVLMAVAGIVGWRGDHIGLGQVVKAVEPIKNEVEGMGEKLRDSLSPQVQTRVNRLRSVFGLKK
jgi:hypothetical protein